MTYIGKIDLLEKAYRKLLVGETLSYEEKSLLLATAICLLKEYGEVYRPEDEERKLLYVDLRQKNETEMLNLAIIKLKIEDDFLSYKFNKFVELLHEYELITDEEYNFTTYGTEDEFEIKLVKQGLPIHLVSKLTRDQQLSNLHFDENNIVHCNSSFHTYYELLDDFYQYQINKYIYV